MGNPKLRNIEAHPAVIDGSSVIILRDPEGLSKNTLFIPHNEAMLFILSCLDGEHSILDIQASFMRRFGTLLLTNQIQGIIGNLNENHFLENEDFSNFRKGITDSFKTASVRESSLAGVSYPPNIEGIDRLLGAMLAAARQSGSLDGLLPGESPRALIAPHIDFVRGGRVYGAAYGALTTNVQPDVFVIFGTLHAPAPTLFIPTRKDFETPLGVAETDTELLDDLERQLSPERLYADEFLHRAEHSIEFQVLWLQYILRGRKPVRILPVLCSSFDSFIKKGITPDKDENVRSFLDALADVLEKNRRDVILIAGADLSHVGPAFGDSERVSDELLSEVSDSDRRVLEATCTSDANLFFDEIASKKDRYRVCGLPPVYALLKLLGKTTGKLLDYEQSLDTHRTTLVSFAGVAFY